MAALPAGCSGTPVLDRQDPTGMYFSATTTVCNQDGLPTSIELEASEDTLIPGLFLGQYSAQVVFPLTLTFTCGADTTDVELTESSFTNPGGHRLPSLIRLPSGTRCTMSLTASASTSPAAKFSLRNIMMGM